MSIPTPEPIGKYIATWGEGPIWHQDRLFYVDIEAHKVIRLDPKSGEETVWDVGQRVGTVVGRESGGLIFAGEKGIFALNTEDGRSEFLLDPEKHLPDNRFNDGKCDPAGRFWVGSMPLKNRLPVASLYCVEKDLSFTNKFSPVTVSNGLVWTKDHKTMFYIDSPRKNVLAFDYDLATGEISNERVALDLSSYQGTSPDGMAIDTEDRLWIAFCHGGVVRCFNTSNGLLEAEVHVPAREVTACTFGGPDLQDLFITTGLPKEDVEPLAGRLFVTRPGATGVPSPAFIG